MTESIDDLCVWHKSATTKQAENIKDESHPLYKCKTCPNPYDGNCREYNSYSLHLQKRIKGLVNEANLLIKSYNESRGDEEVLFI